VDLVDLRRLPAEYAPFFCPEASLRVLREDGKCFTLKLPGDWEAFHASLKKNFRANLRKRDAKLLKKHAITYSDFQGGADNRRDALPICREGSENSWQGRTKVSVLASARKINLLENLTRTDIGQRLYALNVDGAPAAVKWVFERGQRALFHFSEYRPEFGGYGVANLLTAQAVKRCIAMGVEEIDSGYGESNQKYDWGAAPSDLVRLMIPLTARGLVLCSYQRLRWLAGSARNRLRENAPAVLAGLSTFFGKTGGRDKPEAGGHAN